jgi:hypothetical protein
MWIDIRWPHNQFLGMVSRLMHASRAQLDECEISQNGLHWDALDEDVSITGLLAAAA